MAESQDTLIELTAQIISAHVSRNEVTAEQLPALIRQVHATLDRVSRDESLPETIAPAVPIAASVKSDVVVCLHCGSAFKMLKRHLMATHDQNPDEYRKQWKLPESYPMVASNYAKIRSALAIQHGLGTGHMTPAGKARRSESGH
jgi:predicted transcriptional regulator